MANLPCGDFDRNAVWLQLALTAANLIAWTQALCLDGELARAEPARLRYQLWHVAARIHRRGRQLWVRLQHDWAWADQLVAASPGRSAPHRPASPSSHPHRQAWPGSAAPYNPLNRPALPLHE
jgi:hypothetical protein